MTKNRLTTLTTLMQQQKQQRDTAQGLLAQATQRAQAAQRQADDLSDYHQAFHARWGAQPGQRLDMTVLRAYQGFGQRLEHAIGVQQGACEHHDARVAQARAQLTQRETRLATTERLIERTETSLASAEERREQKRADEAAALRLLHHRKDHLP